MGNVTADGKRAVGVRTLRRRGVRLRHRDGHLDAPHCRRPGAARPVRVAAAGTVFPRSYGEHEMTVQCDPFGIPSTSHWTGAAIIVQFSRTKIYIVTRWKTSTRPMLSSLGGWRRICAPGEGCISCEVATLPGDMLIGRLLVSQTAKESECSNSGQAASAATPICRPHPPKRSFALLSARSAPPAPHLSWGSNARTAAVNSCGARHALVNCCANTPHQLHESSNRRVANHVWRSNHALQPTPSRCALSASDCESCSTRRGDWMTLLSAVLVRPS